MRMENGDELIEPGEYDLGEHRKLRVFFVGSKETGRKLWACAAYDHGPFCRLCQEVDEVLNGCLTNVLDGRMTCRQGPDGGFSFKLTQAGFDAVRVMIEWNE